MEILTRDYGTIEVDEASVIRFEDGLFAFDDYHDYVLLDDSNGESPFRCLQSIEESNLAFVMMDPFEIKSDYEIVLGEDLIESLDITELDGILILSIVSVPEDVKKSSINLRAPIIINVNKCKGAQYVVDNDQYRVRHYLINEVINVKAERDDCGAIIQDGTDCMEAEFAIERNNVTKVE